MEDMGQLEVVFWAVVTSILTSGVFFLALRDKLRPSFASSEQHAELVKEVERVDTKATGLYEKQHEHGERLARTESEVDAAKDRITESVTKPLDRVEKRLDTLNLQVQEVLLALTKVNS